MDNSENAHKKPSSKAADSSGPRSIAYYLHFDKASRKVGPLATKAYFQVRDFVEVLASLIPKFPSENETPVVKVSQEENVKNTVKKFNEVLAETKTVFPITLFPDTVILDRSNLTVIRRTFFMTSRTITIHVEDLLNVSVSVGPFFGSLTIAIKGLTSKDHFTVNYFWRKDAIRMKHLLQGYINATHEKINTSDLNKEELLEALDDLGHDPNN